LPSWVVCWATAGKVLTSAAVMAASFSDLDISGLPLRLVMKNLICAKLMPYNL
jgi:hypothetical protein